MLYFISIFAGTAAALGTLAVMAKRHSTTLKQALTYILLLTTFVCFGTPTKVTRIIDGDTFITETGEKVHRQ